MIPSSIFKVNSSTLKSLSLWHFWLCLLRSLVITFGEGTGTPLQYSCLENPMDGRAWWAAVHGVAKSRTRLSNFTFTFHFPALEKEMVTHSSVLAWRIPGTGEPDGLLSVGSHRVGHDWSGLAAAAAATLMIMVSENSFNRNRPLPLYPVCIWQSTSSWFHLTSVQVRWKFWVQVTSTQ